MLRGDGLGTGAHVVGQQQLAAGRGGDLVDGVPCRALIRDVERADLVHFITEEIDTVRVLRGGWEHVDDAASHREFAAALHHVDPRIRRVYEGLEHVGELVLFPDGERHGPHLG